VYVTIDSDIHYEAAPHAALGHDVLALAALGDADDPASRRRRDVAAASERLDGRGRLEPGERDFEARGDVAKGFGRAVERIRVLDPRHRFFPGEVAKLFLCVRQSFGVDLEPEEEFCCPLKELKWSRAQDFDLRQ